MNSAGELKSFLSRIKVEKLFLSGLMLRKKPTYSALFKKKGTTSGERHVSGRCEAMAHSFIEVFDDELFVCLVVSVGVGRSLIKSSGCTRVGLGEGFERGSRRASTQNPLNNLLSSNKSCYGKNQQGLMVPRVSCLDWNGAYRLLPLPMRLIFFFFFFFFAFCVLLVFPMMCPPQIVNFVARYLGVLRIASCINRD